MPDLHTVRSKAQSWILVSVLLILSGCATMGKNECLNAQWQSVGYEDGIKGYTGVRIGEYRKSCAQYNVTPDLKSYNNGRRQGLQEWCTPGNGFYQGTRGLVYNGVCPKELESDFQRAMIEGKAIYDYRRRVNNHKAELSRLHKELDTIEEDIAVMEAELISDQVRPRRRRLLLDDIRAAEKDRDALFYEISDAEAVLGEMEDTLKKMQVMR
ncbi:MAG: DUF2799 domain-containing protein [Desulforhopalus sp.]